jgi:hypothetical protein
LSKRITPLQLSTSDWRRFRRLAYEAADAGLLRVTLLATGHSSPADTRLLIREAKARGIGRVLVTHAMLSPVNMSIAQMKEAGEQGVFIEFVYNGLVGANKEVTPEQYALAIRSVGPGRCILASDLGQAGNPLPVEGLRSFLELMGKLGFTAAEIRRMTVENPAFLPGLD